VYARIWATDGIYYSTLASRLLKTAHYYVSHTKEVGTLGEVQCPLTSILKFLPEMQQTWHSYRWRSQK
jgi:hypothetical protein